MNLRDPLLQPFVNGIVVLPQLVEFESGPCASRHVADWLPATARALYRSLTGDFAFTTGWYSAAKSDDSVRITRNGDSVIVEAKVAGDASGCAALDLSEIADAAILAEVEKAVWTAIENARLSNQLGSALFHQQVTCPAAPPVGRLPLVAEPAPKVKYRREKMRAEPTFEELAQRVVLIDHDRQTRSAVL